MTHASLFSGIGGPEVAAAMLGWDNAFHCEINPFGRRVLDYWFPDSVSYEDITKTDFTQWRGKIDVLTGGFPCQPFSYAGKRGGQNDDRYLWPEMLRAIDEIRPAWVVGENVAGLATMVEGGILTDMGCEETLFNQGDGLHRYHLRETFTIERICRDLERAGYSVQPMLIPAAAVGAPHRRDRIFIIAHDSDHETVRRNARGISGATSEKWVSERDEVQLAGIAGQILRDTANTDRRRSGEIPAPVHAGQSDGDESFCDGSKRYASDSYGKGLQESQQPGWGKDSEKNGAGMDDRTFRPCGHEDAADTNPEGLSTPVQSGIHGQKERNGKKRPAFHTSDDAWAQGTWWDNFPTQSPVHAGNDGISIRMDGITIPFNKWRTEALKAYGNAIVPQIMYRIFQAIEEVS